MGGGGGGHLLKRSLVELVGGVGSVDALRAERDSFLDLERHKAQHKKHKKGTITFGQAYA